MSHKIESKDRVFTLTKAWHGKETIVEKITGYGFEVTEKPLYLDADSAPIEGHKAIVDNEGNLISVMKSSYELINNERTWNAVSAAVAQIEGAKVISAGSIKGRKQTFASVLIDGVSDFMAAGDKHTAVMNIINSHDGTKACTARFGVTRIVCANKMRIAENEAKASLKLYHTKRARLEILGMTETVANLVKATEAYAKQMEALKSEDCTEEETSRFLAAFLAPAGDNELSTRSRNQLAQMVGLFNHGKGNVGKTRYDSLNSITEFYTHHASDDAGKLFESSEFGAYADKKESALGLLLSPREGWANLQAKGKHLLAAV